MKLLEVKTSKQLWAALQTKDGSLSFRFGEIDDFIAQLPDGGERTAIREAYSGLISKFGDKLTHQATELNEVIIKTWGGKPTAFGEILRSVKAPLRAVGGIC